MKKGILLMLLISSVVVNAQSLKDALYGGKLKTDTGTVIRKGDDLSSKIDTSRKKPVEPEKIKVVTTAGDSSVKALATQSDSTKIPGADKNDNVVVLKDNNKIWKEYMDSVVGALKTEVLPSKKIKNDTYYVLVEYEIGIDGEVTINNVWPSPENTFLQQQVKERLTLSAPRLNPVLSGNGKPRKAIKKYNFTLVKM
jgi:hypothetical protein